MERKKGLADVDKGSIENAYNGFVLAAFCNGAVACVVVVFGSWIMATICYLAATVARICAGRVMNQMGEAVAVNAWNNRYHRFVTIALNFGVGAVLLGELWWIRWSMGERYDYMRARWFLTIAIALYLAAIKFMWRNTLMARVGSAALTIVLGCTIAYLAWPGHAVACFVVGAAAINLACLRLHALKGRFNWSHW